MSAESGLYYGSFSIVVQPTLFICANYYENVTILF